MTRTWHVTSAEDEPGGVPGAGKTPARRRRAIVLSSLRSVAAVVLLVVVYYRAPLDAPLTLTTGLQFVAGLVGFAVLVIWQVGAILRSDMPRMRAIQAAAVAAPLLLLVFASAYVIIDSGAPGSFSEPLSRTDALYFTLTTFATVGYGDITPLTELARIVTMAQMVAGIVTVGVIAKILLGAAELAVRRRGGTESPGSG